MMARRAAVLHPGDCRHCRMFEGSWWRRLTPAFATAVSELPARTAMEDDMKLETRFAWRQPSLPFSGLMTRGVKSILKARAETRPTGESIGKAVEKRM